MKHQTTNQGLFIDHDQWIQMMMSYVPGARWLCCWLHTNLWETEPCHQRSWVGIEANSGEYEMSQSFCESWLLPGSDLKKRERERERENKYAYWKLEQRSCTERLFGVVHSFQGMKTHLLSEWRYWKLAGLGLCVWPDGAGDHFQMGQAPGEEAFTWMKSRNFTESFSVTSFPSLVTRRQVPKPFLREIWRDPKTQT